MFSFFLFKEYTSGPAEPKQKRKLAYSMDIVKGPDCILLDVTNNKKQPAKLLFKQHKNSWCHSKPRSSLPVDILIQLSWFNLNSSACGFGPKHEFKELKDLFKMSRIITCCLQNIFNILK